MFLPTVMVRDMMQKDHPSRMRKALMKAVKAREADEEVTARMAGVQELPKQGHMLDLRACTAIKWIYH